MSTDFHITDTESAYAELASPKCLIQHGYVKRSDFFSEAELNRINAPSVTLDFDAVEKMNVELREVIGKLKGKKLRANAAMKTRKTQEAVHFSLLFDTFKKLITEKYFLQCVVREIENELLQKGSFVLQFLLSDKMRLSDNQLHLKCTASYHYLSASGKLSALSWKKKWFYAFWQLKNNWSFRNKSKAKKHIAVYLYDSPHYVTLLNRFLELAAREKDVHVSIIKITTGIEAGRAASFDALRSEKCTVYDIADFRCVPFEGHDDLWNSLTAIDPRYKVIGKYQSLANLELYYAWISESMRLLQPHSALFLGHTDIGRAVSDCARLNHVKSVNAEYTFIFDAPIMDLNICFDVRACVSETSVQTWQHFNDPSAKQESIGYLRFDDQPTIGNKEDFFKINNLNARQPTIFFASTWGAANKIHDVEKGLLCDAISKLCAEKNWNFIVKKHPSESDDVVKNVLEKNNFPNQRCFAHHEILLNDAIAWSDLISTQSSSIVLEAVYFEKPFCFVSYFGGRSLTDYLLFMDEPGLGNLKSAEAFRNFATAILEGGQGMIRPDFARLKKRLLFATDAKASERLLRLLTE